MPIDQYQREGWSTPRAEVTVATDDTPLAVATTMKFANIPAGAYKPRPDQKTLEIAWTQVTDADACVVYLYAARTGGDITLAWKGALTCGKQAATGTRLYTDTITTTADTWITAVNLVDESANDQMARIVLDTHGYAYFFCLYTGLAGTETVQAHYSGY